jgi:hypothetical protein
MVGHAQDTFARDFNTVRHCLEAKGNVLTVDEMNDLQREDGSSVVEVGGIDFIGDWEQWITGSVSQFTSRSFHDRHHVRIKRDVDDGPVLLRSKHLASDEKWLPQEGLVILQSVPSRDVLPEPYIVLGSGDNAAYIQRLQETFRMLQQEGILKEDSQEWWRTFLADAARPEVPANYSQSYDMSGIFPGRNDDNWKAEEKRISEAERLSSILTAEDRVNFGDCQRKDAYTGKIMTRKRRNDRAVNVDTMMANSFVMIRSQDNETPYFFGTVTNIAFESRTFSVHYFGGDYSQRFWPLYTKVSTEVSKPKGRRNAAKYIGEASFDSVMMFDLNTTAPTKLGVMMLTKKGKARVVDILKEHGLMEDLAPADDKSQND